MTVLPVSPSVTQLVERTLRDRIVSGQLAPDTPLRQDHIARELQVSIACVREALRRLESDGLAVFRPRRGVVVASASGDELWEILEIRLALESLALRETIKRRTPEIMARLHAATPSGTSPSDPAIWLPENRAFHRALCEPSAMPRLVALIDQLVLAGDRYVMLVAARWPLATSEAADPTQLAHVAGYPGVMRDRHRAIVAAVEAGRTAAALRALREDMLGGGRELAAMFDGQSRGAAT